ESELNLN
ncbi:hypothetical protein ACN38_g5411, partial [Penicillium nordicum]